MNGEIYSIEYANARAEEIKEIEKSISETKKKKMLFQTLPFHKRRRTASFDERRLPKELRRAARTKRRRVKQTVKDQKNLLKAHTWYAKRFTMYKRGDMYVPFKRHSKSDSFIAKSLQTRGVLCDISYNRVYVSKEKCESRVQYTGAYNRAIIWNTTEENRPSGEEKKEDRFLDSTIIITEKISEVNSKIEMFKEIEGLSVFEIFGSQLLFAKTSYVNCQSVESLLSSAELSYICLRYIDKSFILVARRHCMELLQKAVVGGIVPCGILELQRIAAETGKVVYPYEIPMHVQGSAFLEHMHNIEKEEQERKPKGKKDVIFLPTYEEKLKNQTMILFVADKGSFPCRSVVVQSSKTADFDMDGEEEIVGEVGRSSFSFKKGRTVGLAYISKDVETGKSLFIRNLKNRIFRKVEYKVVDFSMIL